MSEAIRTAIKRARTYRSIMDACDVLDAIADRLDAMSAPAPAGCICPPTSEQTCRNPICPRRGRVSVAFGSKGPQIGGGYKP